VITTGGSSQLNAWDEDWDDYRNITGISWEYDRDLMGINGIQSSQLGIYIYNHIYILPTKMVI